MKIKTIGNLTESMFKECNARGSTEEKLGFVLQRFNIVRPDETLIFYNELYDWKRGGSETYISAADLGVISAGKIVERPFIAKAIVSGFGDLHNRALKMHQRQQHLESIGIRTPKTYSVKNAIFYQQLLPKEVSDLVRQGDFNNAFLDELIDYAAKLDNAGYRTRGFIGDLMADSDHLYYVDFGADLGTSDPIGAGDDSLRSLLEFARLHLRRSGAKQEDIKRKYLVKYRGIAK